MSGAPKVKLILGAGVALLVASLALPYYGWSGSRTAGQTVGLLAGAAVVAASLRGRRWTAAVGPLLGLGSVGLLTWRLATPPTVPLVLRGLLGHAYSTAGVAVGLAGAVLVTLAGVVAFARERQSARPPALPEGQRLALATAWRATWTSRLLIWGAGVLTVLRTHPQTVSAGASIARPFGYLGTLLTAPASAWDAGYYLSIARYGYAGGPDLAAFFPLYPTLMRAGAWSVKGALVMGVAISVGALVGALYLLYRLVALECGDDAARLAVVLTAFFPMALFFSAVYTESLFLLLTLGAFYSGRRGWWGRAGVIGALAAATRVTGVLIVVPLVVMYVFGPREDGEDARAWTSWRERFGARHPLRADFAYLLLVPLGLVAYFAYQGIHGDSLAPLHAEQIYWHRATGPLLGAVDGARDLVRSLLQIAGGPTSHHLPSQPSNQLLTPSTLAGDNITDFAFLAFGCVATVGAFRRLPAAYGTYAAVSVAVSASSVTHYEPLASFPRYVAVLFPCQIWLALWARSRSSRRTLALAVSAGLLAVFAGEFSTWVWVA